MVHRRYGDVKTMITMANVSISVMHHVVTKEFEQRPGGGIAQQWGKGEGWPEWSGGIAAMYATEITANHMMAEFESSDKYDVHGDSDARVSEVRVWLDWKAEQCFACGHDEDEGGRPE